MTKNGIMFFVVVSTKAEMFGRGKQISRNRFEIDKGANVFFFDSKAIEKEFKKFGLIEYKEIDEPIKFIENEPPLKCFIIKCKKR